MAKSKTPTLRKPVLSADAVLGFAEGRTAAKSTKGTGKTSGASVAPSGDVRLTVNIRDDIHQKLKIEAVKRRTTVGELLEELVQRHL